MGVSIECVDQKDLIQKAIEWARQPGQVAISYVNAHCLNLAQIDAEYRRILNDFDLVYSDGIGVVWAGRFLYGKQLFKVTGRAWIAELCHSCQSEGISLYLLGGKPGVAQEARRRLQTKLPGLRILGTGDGYFREKSEAEVLAEIIELKPDILLIGMGVPLQEKWIVAHRNQINTKICWAVGALIDYIAGVEPPVPAWIEKLALEWMWRLLLNPREKWQRYIIGNPLFVARVLGEKMK